MTDPIPAGLSVTADNFNLRLPHRIATSTSTSNEDFEGTEVPLDTVASDPDVLVVGELYAVWYRANFSAVTGNDQARLRIRQDSETGTILLSERIRCPAFADTHVALLHHEFVATGTSATFVVTGQRTSGSSTITRRGAAEQVVYFWIEKV